MWLNRLYTSDSHIVIDINVTLWKITYEYWVWSHLLIWHFMRRVRGLRLAIWEATTFSRQDITFTFQTVISKYLIWRSVFYFFSLSLFTHLSCCYSSLKCLHIKLWGPVEIYLELCWVKNIPTFLQLTHKCKCLVMAWWSRDVSQSRDWWV